MPQVWMHGHGVSFGCTSVDAAACGSPVRRRASHGMGYAILVSMRVLPCIHMGRLGARILKAVPPLCQPGGRIDMRGWHGCRGTG